LAGVLDFKMTDAVFGFRVKGKDKVTHTDRGNICYLGAKMLEYLSHKSPEHLRKTARRLELVNGEDEVPKKWVAHYKGFLDKLFNTS